MGISTRRGLVLGLALVLPAVALAVPAAGGPATVPGPRLVEVGQVGGATGAIAAAGSLVAFGEGPRLSLAEASDPAAPRALGQTAPLGDLVAAVELVGQLAFVAAGEGGLVLVDARRPQAPVILARLTLPGPARDVAVQGQTAFVAAGEGGLALVDVADPERPELLARLPLPHSAERVTAGGGYAYALSASWSLDTYGMPFLEAAQTWIIDAREPRKPELRGGLTRMDYLYPAPPLLALDGLLLVATGGTGPALGVYSLANPARPVLAGYLDARSAIRDIAAGLRPRTALVASGLGHPDGGRVTEIHLDNPGNPTAGATWDTSELGQAAVTAGPDGLAFATLAEGGFTVLGSQAGAPSTGRVLGRLATMGRARAVTGAGGRAFVAAGGAGLAVVDLAERARPLVLGRLPAGPGGAVVSYEDVAVPAGPGEPPAWAYAASRHGDVESSALRVIDLRDARQPREVGVWDLPWRTAAAVAAAGDTAYLGHEAGFEVIAVTDKDWPRPLRSVAVQDGVTDLDVADGWLYLTGGREDLGLYRLANPTAPARVARLELDGYGLAVAVGEGAAFVVAPMSRFGDRSEDPRSWLHVVDLRRPTTPTLRASVELPGRPLSVASLPGQVVVGLAGPGTPGGRGLLLAYDVRDPGAPALLARRSLLGQPAGLAALGDALLVAADEGGLLRDGWDWPLYLPQLLRAGQRPAGVP